MELFGPILGPAFAKNQAARILLIRALDHFSRKEIREGTRLLKGIQEYCTNADDMAAWIFFMALRFGMLGERQKMLEWRKRAKQYNHRLCWSYLELAMENYTGGNFQKAKTDNGN